jgi:hypothetical protein
MKTGLESLDVGAPEITYSGNQGPKSPQEDQRMMQEFQMAQLQEEYDKHVFEMEEMGLEPMSMQQFLEQVMSEAQMSSNQQGIGTMMQGPRTMAKGGGIMNNKKIKGQDHMLAYITPSEATQLEKLGGQKTMTKEGIPAYPPGEKYGGKDESGNFNDPTPSSPSSSSPSNNQSSDGGNGGQTMQDYLDDQANFLDSPEAQANIKDSGYAGGTKEQFEKTKAAMEAAKTEQEKKDAEEKEKQRLEEEEKERQRIQDLINKNKELYAGQKQKVIATKFGTSPNKRTKLTEQQRLDLFDDNKDGKIGPLEALNEMRTNMTRSTLDKSVRNKLGVGPNQDLGDMFDPTFDMGLYGLSGKDLAVAQKQAEFAGKDRITQDQFESVYRPYDQMFIDGEFTPGPILPMGGGGGGGGDGSQTQDPTDPADPADPADPYDDTITQRLALPYNFSVNTDDLTKGRGGFFYNDGGRAGYMGGGIADLRQGYFLGKLVKKITRGAKKVFKSPFGKAALLGLGAYFMPGIGIKAMNASGTPFFSKGIGKFLSNTAGKALLTDPSKGFSFANLSPFKTFSTATSLYPLVEAGINKFRGKRDDESDEEYNAQKQAFIDANPQFKNPFPFKRGALPFANGGDVDDDDDLSPRAALARAKKFYASGGLAGLPPVTMMSEGQDIQSFPDDESTGIAQATPQDQMPMPARQPMMNPMMDPRMARGMMDPRMMQQRPRIMAQEGGMMDMGGMEKDYRNEGGFVPIGGQERADDVPARLSKNEFVFTADAVRNAGGGNIDKGAEIMENLMENLEQGGKVSKASQGLSGAREMFATQQRLGEVL